MSGIVLFVCCNEVIYGGVVLYGKGVLLWNTCYVFMFVLTSEYTCILNIEFCVISLPN